MIEQIKQALEKANQGGWTWGRKTIQADEDGDVYLGDSLTRWTLNSRGNRVGNMILRIEQNEHGINEIVGFNTQDVHLIANAPEWLRYLIGEVERLKEIDERESLITINIRNKNKELQKIIETAVMFLRSNELHVKAEQIKAMVKKGLNHEIR